MRHLLILRHAKSSWSDGTLRDHERPLNKRGRLAAAAMGRFMADGGMLPDLVISSDSSRTRETVELWSEAAAWNGRPDFRSELYLASPSDLIDAARSAPEHAGRVMLVAHNPGIEELVSRAAGDIVDMPTGTLAMFDVECSSWNQLDARAMTLALHQRPRELSD